MSRTARQRSGASRTIIGPQAFRDYSYLLRCDLARARVQFQRAYQLDPTNRTVVNNLQLLNSSYRFIQRAD
jgi:Flp pilus assembly protein TadD